MRVIGPVGWHLRLSKPNVPLFLNLIAFGLLEDGFDLLGHGLGPDHLVLLLDLPGILDLLLEAFQDDGVLLDIVGLLLGLVVHPLDLLIHNIRVEFGKLLSDLLLDFCDVELEYTRSEGLDVLHEGVVTTLFKEFEFVRVEFISFVPVPVRLFFVEHLAVARRAAV